MVGRPNLVLSHVGAEDAVGLHPAGQRVHEGLRFHKALHRLDGLGGVALLAFGDRLHPLLGSLAVDVLGQLLQHVLQIAHNRDMGGHILADLGGIDVDVDDLGAGGHLTGQRPRPCPPPGRRP